jgi:hypothetical protein
VSVGTGLLFPHRYSSPVRGYNAGWYGVTLYVGWYGVTFSSPVFLTGTGLLSALSLLLEGYPHRYPHRYGVTFSSLSPTGGIHTKPQSDRGVAPDAPVPL